MKFLKKFSNFINESYWIEQRDRLVDTYSRELDTLSTFNEDLEESLRDFDKWVDELDSRKWGYNRYSRDIRRPHYAIDVKTYNSPSLEQYQEAADDPEASADNMDRDWWTWLEMEIEDFVNNVFLEDYRDVFDTVTMGGSSGGWMCPIPDNSIDDLITGVQEEMDEYADHLRNLDESELQDIRAFHEYSPEERTRLTDLGLVQNENAYDEAVEKKLTVIRKIEENTETLIRHREALEFIEKKHAEFEKNAETNFLSFVRESRL